MSTTKKIVTVGPNMGVRFYSNASALSRALSGYGTDSRRKTISRRLAQGGGFVGKVWVAPR